MNVESSVFVNVFYLVLLVIYVLRKSYHRKKGVKNVRSLIRLNIIFAHIAGKFDCILFPEAASEQCCDAHHTKLGFLPIFTQTL